MDSTVRLITPDELAEYLHIPRQTLAYWRCKGEGPTFIKVGRSVRYRVGDVEAWLDEHAEAA